MSQDFYNSVGKAGIGSRLRMLQEKINEDALAIYRMFGIAFQPKWFPVFYTLQDRGNTITEIAKHIGHSHPSVSRIVSEMIKAGVVEENKDPKDGRRNMVSLTLLGKDFQEKLKYQLVDVENAVEGILSHTTHNLWLAIEEWEFMLEQQSLLLRVKAQKKKRESAEISIVPFEDRFREAFKILNVEWISSYFQMEEKDFIALEDPKKSIIEKGGEILVALYKNEPVGVCALMKMEDPLYDFELAKMAVSPTAHGKGIGFLLGKAIVDLAKVKHGKMLYLESNTMLIQAINLYHKLGFKKVAGRSTPYERCNIQMELNLKNII